MMQSLLGELYYHKAKYYKAILKKWLLYSLFGRPRKNRDTSFVGKEYGAVWSKDRFELERDRPQIQELRGQAVWWRSIDRKRFTISHISNTIRSLDGIKSVLEMGSGGGINILALAILHPDIPEWHGVELTPEGVSVSQNILLSPPYDYLEYVTGFSRDEILKRLSHAHITFHKGDMTRLPFERDSIDLVFSCQAIEQLPRAYPEAFCEAKRVTRAHALFLEEFREAQANIFERMHLKNRDYFRASFHEAEKAGFTIISFEPFPLKQLYYSLGFLVCAS